MAELTAKVQTSSERKEGERILKRWDALNTRWDPWRQPWENVGKFCNPVLEDTYEINPERAKRATHMYDGTPTESLGIFADGMHGYMTSPSIPWFKIPAVKRGRTNSMLFKNIDVGEFNEIPEVAEWRDACEEVIYGVLNDSNFYTEIHAIYRNGGSIGTAPFYIEEDIERNGIHCEAWNPRQCRATVNRFGMVDGIYRQYWLSARVLYMMFPDNLPQEVISAIKTDALDQMFECVQAIYPRTDYDPSKIDNKNKPFASYYILKSGHVLGESGYDEFPAPTWRYVTDGYWEYGFSPAMFSMPDIMTLHAMGKSLLRVAQREAQPPWNVPSEMSGKVDLNPDGLNYYNSGTNALLQPVQVRGNYSVGLDRENDKREAVRRAFHVNFFLMLAQAEADGRDITATEVMERQGEKAIVLGATVSRFNREILDPVISRIFNIGMRAGWMPEPPDVMSEYGFTEYDIDYQGPLAQAQRRFFRSNPILNALNGIAGLVELDANARFVLEATEAAQEILKANGVPAKVLRSTDEIKQMMEQERQAMAAQQALESLPPTAKAAKDMSEADPTGQIFDALNQQVGS